MRSVFCTSQALIADSSARKGIAVLAPIPLIDVNTSRSCTIVALQMFSSSSVISVSRCCRCRSVAIFPGTIILSPERWMRRSSPRRLHDLLGRDRRSFLLSAGGRALLIALGFASRIFLADGNALRSSSIPRENTLQSDGNSGNVLCRAWRISVFVFAMRWLMILVPAPTP